MKPWMRRFLVINHYGDALVVYRNWELESLGCSPSQALEIQKALLNDRGYQIRLWKKIEENEISEELTKRG